MIEGFSTYLANGLVKLARRSRQCIFQRQLPNRVRYLLYEHGLVRRDWILWLRLQSALSRRIRVGFGPVVAGEDTLGSRKWRIDAVVNSINRHSRRFGATIFFRGDDLTCFDIVVVVKEFDYFTPNIISDLHARGIRIIYDTADVRYTFAEGRLHDLSTDRTAWEKYYRPFVSSVDGLILANPNMQDVDNNQAIPRMKIALPILNRRRRTRYAHAGPIRLIWQGYPENMAPMLRLHPIIDRLRKDTGLDIRLVYDTKVTPRREGPIEYREWNVHQWDHVLAEADIGVTIKPLDDPYQQRKPATKVISYMAAALPVVCTPSQSDRQVIHHGKTGYFAYNDQQWYSFLHDLVQDPSLRSRIGNAARRQVIESYGDKQVAAVYEDLFERVLGNRPPTQG
jgi:hypothetical protein